MAIYSHNTNDLTPLMTGYITPTPAIVSASSEYNVSYQSWMAFNHVGTDAPGWASGSGLIPAWLQIYSGRDFWYVTSYTVCVFYGTSNSAPSNWTLLGCNDGESWTLLDTQTNQINWGTTEMRSFTVASPNSYLYYRINITSSNGSVFTGIGELELIGTIGLVASAVRLSFRGHDRFVNYKIL